MTSTSAVTSDIKMLLALLDAVVCDTTKMFMQMKMKTGVMVM